MADEYDVAQVQFVNDFQDVAGIAGERGVLDRVPRAWIGRSRSDEVDEYQTEVRPEFVDNETPEVLIASEAMDQQDRRAVFGAYDVDVVPGVNVHQARLDREPIFARHITRE